MLAVGGCRRSEQHTRERAESLVGHQPSTITSPSSGEMEENRGERHKEIERMRGQEATGFGSIPLTTPENLQTVEKYRKEVAGWI